MLSVPVQEAMDILEKIKEAGGIEKVKAHLNAVEAAEIALAAVGGIAGAKYAAAFMACCRDILEGAVSIIGGHRVTKGSEVWIWLNADANNPALVRKVVMDLGGKPYVWQQGPMGWLQAAYADNLHCAYGVAANRCYASEQEALDGRPDLADKRETALIRAGRQQGERVRTRVAA
jgi:hypothetical protein